MIVWKRLENSNYQQEIQFTGHNHFVNTLAFIQPSGQFASGNERRVHVGLVLSGGFDKIIYAFSPIDPTIVWKMEGHKDNVCALAVGPDSTFVSGSWDK